MKKRTRMHKGIHSRVFKVTLTILTLIFLLTSVSAAFSEEESWIAVLEKNGNSVYFADHSEGLTEGGWILLSGGKEIKLPQPLIFTYNGTTTLKSEGAALELKPGVSDNNTIITLTYPYTTHPFYTEKDNVNVDYKGPAAFGQQKVNVYLVKGLDLNSLDEAFTDTRNENTVNIKEIFDNITNTTTLITTVILNENGDLPSSLTLDPLSAGSYGVLVMLAGNENEKSKPEKKVLSATCFEVLKYKLKITSRNKIAESNNLDVNMNLEKAPAGNYTYGALLIREDAYSAGINVNSNGTIAGTNMFINGIDIINEFEINSTNYRSKLSRNELTTEIQTLIGEGNGTISIGEENQKVLSLTAFDLPKGDYILFAGAYEKGKGLVGIDQKEISINKVEKTTRSSINQKSDIYLPAKSQNSHISETEDSVSKASSSLELEDLEEPQIRGEIIQTEDIIKNEKLKMISFIIGFVGTLLIGIMTIRGRH